MQKVAILLRKSQRPNRFRQVILNALGEPTLTKFTIASGFFQEAYRFPKIKVSPDIIDRLRMRTVAAEITAVGIYNWSWWWQFKRFVRRVRTASPGMTVNARRIRGDHWHAKIFVACNTTGPVLAIVGSSNITGRAFQELPAWNYEADSVFWLDNLPAVSSTVRRGLLEDNQAADDGSVMIADYEQSDPINRNAPLSKRLQQILSDIDTASDPISA